MASLRILPAVTAAVLFYVVVAVAATDAPDFVIQGRVYCDTCRAGFQTNVTEYIKGITMPFLTSAAAVEGDTKHISMDNPCNDGTPDSAFLRSLMSIGLTWVFVLLDHRRQGQAGVQALWHRCRRARC
jgi:hypothetical protein